MKTFLQATAALRSLPIYAAAVWFGLPFAGALLGLGFAVAWSVHRHRGARPPVFEIALIVGFAVLVLAHAFGAASLLANATALLMLALGIGAALSVATGRPWTAEFSAAEYRGSAATPLFKSINMQLSAIWAALFCWIAFASLAGLPAVARWLPLAAGGVASVVLPRLLVRRGLTALAKGDEHNDWPAPDFSVPPHRAPDADETCDVAIIGAGIGGLTAAALLADSGLKVVVCEQHLVPGGFAHNWLRRARALDRSSHDKLIFRFDSGVHDVSGWQPGGPVRRVFERLGIADDVAWHRLDHRYVLDGKTIDVPRDWRLYAKLLGEHYPGEAAGIAALFEDIFTVFTSMFSTGAKRGGIPGMPADADALLAFAEANPLAVTWRDRPWTEFVARHVTGAGPLEWISALGGYITDDIGKTSVGQMVPIYGYYFNGGYYPEGGSGAMADSLVQAIEQRGGRVHLRSPVVRITVDDGAATGLIVEDFRGKQRRIAATAVVCNADAREAMTGLLDDQSFTRALETQSGRLLPACSAVGISLGLSGSLQLPPVVHVVTPDGMAGMVIPSMVDPTCAPPGYSVVEILELISHDEARSWFPPAGADADLDAYRRSPAYIARKAASGDCLIARARQVIPDIDARIVYRSESTPVTYQRYDFSSAGAIYGMTAGGKRLPARMPLRNLVLAGAATHGPGIEAVVISGACAAEVLRPGLLGAEPVQSRRRPAGDRINPNPQADFQDAAL